jgi:glycerophosphoryl diester phosphodiesterase
MKEERLMEDFLVLGHRGYRAKYAENTIEAFQKALEYGADGIEYDSRLTKDGVLVVLHDEEINGIKLNSIEYNQLKNIKFPNGQTIPTVEETIRSLNNKAILNLEVKEVEAAIPSYEITKKLGALKRTLFSSFKVDALRKIRKIDKEVKLGLLVQYDTLDNLPQLHKELSLYSLNLWVDAVKENIQESSKMLRKWKDAGLKIYLWTLNNPQDLYDLEGFYDCVITDEVELIVTERKRMKKKEQSSK